MTNAAPIAASVSPAARSFVRTVEAATRRKYTPEEKIRIVREGIKPHSYYSWTKEFMEAGKERLLPATVCETPPGTRSIVSSERTESSSIWSPIEGRTKLLSDNGPGYVSRAFRDYLGMVGIKHILATPFHPQTNGKLERYHQTLKRDVNQLPYEMPSDLEAAMVAFVSYYNYRRYHKALGNVTPSDVLRGRRQEILRRRKEVQAQTIERRRRHNRTLRELTILQSDP